MAVEQSDGSYFILQSNGQRVRVKADEISQIKDSRVSAMPHGLLDNLSESEINDLFAFLSQRPTATVADSEGVRSGARFDAGDILVR